MDNAEAKTQADEVSPFSCISATMSWETFHMVQMLWLSVAEVPAKEESKDWKIQVRETEARWSADF